MPEAINPKNELTYEEQLQEAWGILETEEQIAGSVEQLMQLTREASETTNIEGLFADEQDLRNRWRSAALLTSRLAESPWSHRDKPEAPDVLRHGLKTIEGSIQKYGWVIPGVSFKILESGFSWTLRDGLQPEERMFDIVDIRDLNKLTSIAAMTQEEYNALSEEETETLRIQANTNLMVKLHGSGLNYSLKIPKKQIAFSDARLLRDLQKKRRFGVPDRELSHQEIGAYLLDIIKHRQTINPSYGEVPADFDNLPENIKESVWWILDYFNNMRDPLTQEDSIDSYSLKNTIGFKRKEINQLVDAGILQPVDSYQGPDRGLYGTYQLSGPYHEFWWVNTVLDRYEEKSS